MTELFASSPFANALGQALVQFVWQGAAIAVVVAALLMVLRRSSPQARYLVAVAGLAALTATPVLTVSSQWRATPESVVVHLQLEQTDTAPPASIASPTAPAPRATLTEWLEPRLPLIVMSWCAGVALLTLHLAGGWWRLTQIARRASPIVTGRVAAALPSIAGRIGVRRRVLLVESALVRMPSVVGWLRPVIVLPVSALAGLPPAHLDAILAHELAHIRRSDFAVNVLQCVVETLLFYHPAVWWVSRRIRVERELCCDDMAAALSPTRVAYARALTSLEELQHATRTVAVAANGGELLQRVRRILEPQDVSGSRWSGGVAMSVVLTVLLFTAGGHTLPASDLPLPAPVVQTTPLPIAAAEAVTIERTLSERAETSRPPVPLDRLGPQAPPQPSPFPMLNPRTLARMSFPNATARDIIAALGKATGITVTYDRNADTQLTQVYQLETQGERFEVVLNQILTAFNMAYKVTGPSSIVIFQAPVALPVSQAAAPVQKPSGRGTIAGTVRDRTAGVIPGATVLVTSIDAPRTGRGAGAPPSPPGVGVEAYAVSDVRGSYTIRNLPPGQYEMRVSLAGFKTAAHRVTVTENQTINTEVTLEVGTLSEAVTVTSPLAASQAARARTGSWPSTTSEYFDAARMYYEQGRLSEAEAMTMRALASMRQAAPEVPVAQARADSSGVIRVGGDIREPKRISTVLPIYPAEAAAAGVQGTVIVEAIIDTVGAVQSAKVLRSVPGLDQAALVAVQQWRYTPTLLNGTPVEVAVTVSVTFTAK